MYFKVALRNLRREKLYAVLNIAGFALGIASCLILGLYLWDELTYDRHHVNHERIYRVAQRVTAPSGKERYESSLALTSSALGPMLGDDFPDVIEQYVRFYKVVPNQRALLRKDDESEYWSDTYLADDNVFDVFTHQIVYGDPRTALTEPSTIAISRTVSERYFGAENPIGRTLLNAVDAPFTVTLVFEDLPENTHLRYDALFAFKGIFAVSDDVNARRRMLNSLNTFTYVVLPENYDASAYGALSRQFFERHMADARRANVTWESWLQPLAGTHLRSDLELDRPTGNALYLYAFAAVGLSLLLITCINYVNLATARAAKRARTIGLRKILGADRAALMVQLLGESVLFALLAAVLGAIAVKVAVSLPAVTAVFGKPLDFDLLGNP
ncbi:MAG TPA: ABC transporter permease, partial [Gammaproteobacteria bacterium]|nr:ABC transporter permease [Gammaproteobacteria bacterium]